MELMDDFPDAAGLSKADKASIKKLAIEKGLIQDVPIKTITDSTGKTYGQNQMLLNLSG